MSEEPITDPTDAQVGGREPLTMVCEGSGCVAHPLQSVMGIGICAMCGRTVSLNGSVALLHTRDDILAMVERGDFDG